MRSIAIFLVVTVLAATADVARAQMFGQRSMGRPLSRQMQPGSFESVGTLTGSERFLRGNRGRADFVGTDSRESEGFVGLQQGRTRGVVRPATSGLRIQTEPDANTTDQDVRRTRTSIYEPRLNVDFSYTPRSSRAIAESAVEQLTASPTLRLAGPIEVSVEAGTATLRGVVASERDRSLAALLLLFEPGIEDVRNELTVRPPLPPPIPSQTR